MKVAGIILAGGQARRMGGGDKALLEADGKPLLGHVIERLAPQVSEIAINANGDANHFAGFGLPVIADTVDGFVGPLGGVLAGMRWAAKQGHSHIVSAAGDTPFFPADLVEKLLAARGDQPISMAASTPPKGPTKPSTVSAITGKSKALNRVGSPLALIAISLI